MRNARLLVLVVFLAVQALFILFGSSREYRPDIPKLDAFPRRLPGWAALYDTPILPQVLMELRADATLSRYYAATGEAAMVHLMVAWFQTQQGNRQPHSPKVCLPGSGWEPVEAGLAPVRDAMVNRYVVTSGPNRSVVLYWYQTPVRTVAGEWEAKFWLMADALRYKRTDTALIRVVAPVVNGKEDAASKTALRFAETVYPLLRKTLPGLPQ